MQITRLLSAVVIIFSFMACNSEGGDDNVRPSYNETYLRFVSPSGTNVLDSLNVLNGAMVGLNTDLISISGIRHSDEQELDITRYWLYASKQTGSEFLTDETLIVLWWNDFKVWNVEKRPKRYDETYEIKLKSPQIFGDEETHTLKWYVSVSGRKQNAYRCEADGQEVALSDDIIYNKKTFDGRHWVTGIVTFFTK
jgi:hypothetical protein